MKGSRTSSVLLQLICLALAGCFTEPLSQLNGETE